MFQQRAALFALFAALFTAPIHAQTCPFDGGNSSLAVEGLILTRYALGLTGAPLVASTAINAVDAPTVEASINCPSCGLNITGNATMTGWPTPPSFRASWPGSAARRSPTI